MVAELKSEGCRIKAIDVRSFDNSEVASLQARGVKSLPAMIYVSSDPKTKDKMYFGWKPKQQVRKMFEYDRPADTTDLASQ